MKRFIAALLICTIFLCSCSNNKVYEDSSENNQSQLETMSQEESKTQNNTDLSLNENNQLETETIIKTEKDETIKSPNKNVNKHNPLKPDTVIQTEENKVTDNEIRGVWISCFELPDATKGEAQFKTTVENIFRNLKKKDYNTVFVHVRPFADSIYPSKIFPWSKYCCKGKNPNFDPLKIIVKAAKANNISVHAWINPFRISTNNDVNALPQSSPAYGMIKNNSSDVAVLSNGIYFNPASTAVHKLIYSGVEEILRNYDVDGIHIDDYFYPTTDEKIDKKEYDGYKNSGGKLSLSDWRKNSVSAFVSGLYELTHKYNKILSVSPSANLDHNEKKLYADIPLWMGEKGYLDIVIPQIYYGFKNEKFPFEETANRWSKIKRNKSVKLVCGIARYKYNKIDKNAGKAGENEWIDNKNIIEEQKKYIRENSNFSGFADYSYSYIF